MKPRTHPLLTGGVLVGLAAAVGTAMATPASGITQTPSSTSSWSSAGRSRSTSGAA
jgi:hypothetical protein